MLRRIRLVSLRLLRILLGSVQLHIGCALWWRLCLGGSLILRRGSGFPGGWRACSGFPDRDFRSVLQLVEPIGNECVAGIDTRNSGRLAVRCRDLDVSRLDGVVAGVYHVNKGNLVVALNGGRRNEV